MNTWLSTRLIFIPICLIFFTSWLVFLSYFKPRLEDSAMVLKFPASLQDVKSLFELLVLYKRKNFYYVILLFGSGYIYKQTFAIPGSALLNVLAGAVFGCWPYGVLFCSLLTAVGASNCFLLSKFCGKDYVRAKFPSQVAWLQLKVEESEGGLFFMLVGLRLFPATPNWLLNVVAPIVGVPLHLFTLSVFLGLIPYNFLCMKTGETLSELESFEDILTPRRLGVLLALALTVMALSKVARSKKVKIS